MSQVYHIFTYLKKYHNTGMVFDPSDPIINEEDFAKQDWTSSELVMWTERKFFLQRIQNQEDKGSE